MTPFSASDAALEGFNLIRRRWRVVLGWAAFNLLALVMVVVVSAMLSLVVSAVAGAGAESTPAMAAAGVFVVGCVLFAQAVIAAGVFRLDLRPEEPSFIHLRVGAAELRLVAIWLLSLTGAWVAWWGGALLAHALGAPGWAADFVAFLVVAYLGLRFVLAAPISFVERRVDFPRAWALSRGRVLALLGMSALSFCLIALVMVSVLVAMVIAALAIGGVHALAGVFGGAEALKSHPAVYLLVFTIQMVLTPVFWVLAMAPLAAAYRAFAGE